MKEFNSAADGNEMEKEQARGNDIVLGGPGGPDPRRAIKRWTYPEIEDLDMDMYYPRH